MVLNDLDWNDRERLARNHWAAAAAEPQTLYLGGDVIRPYLAVTDGSGAYLAWRSETATPLPPMVRRALKTCEAGSPNDIRIDGRTHSTISFEAPSSAGLDRPLPRAALASLTNTRRYGSIRFPLNIARLGQWLRFTHAARVHLFDASLDFDGDVVALGAAIADAQPELVGVSVNFGELGRMTELASLLAKQADPPVLVVGNVLAAWAPDELRNACTGMKPLLVPSYGEQTLEALCRGLMDGVNNIAPSLRTGPPQQIVYPDERLLAKTISSAGQLAIETSFGCQYGACTFCPRDHRGDGWTQARPAEVATVIERMGRTARRLRPRHVSVLSFVDEEAFGTAGRGTDERAPILDFLDTATRAGLSSEIYTRLEQVFDRRRSREWNAARLNALYTQRDQLVRIFVGVESGSDSQLKRYAKGQDVKRIVDSLRAGSLAGLPFEFGFITFDPLLTAAELFENIEFLARRDVVLHPNDDLTPEEIVELVTASPTFQHQRGVPVYESVAYMATELELLATSSYLTLLRRRAPQVIDAYDPSFARWSYAFVDPRIGDIASYCRVWTEGTFRPVYRARLTVRSSSGHGALREMVRRQRAATYSLLVSLADRLIGTDSRVAQAKEGLARHAVPLLNEPLDINTYHQLWSWVTHSIDSNRVGFDVSFDPNMLAGRRDS